MENYLKKQQLLSSSTLNTIYPVNTYSNIEKISRLIALLLNSKIDAAALLGLCLKFMSITIVSLTLVCISLFYFYLPIQNQNIQLSNNAKRLTKEKYTLVAEAQKASSYDRLYLNAPILSLEDSKEIIHIRNKAFVAAKENQGTSALIKYPLIQFSGF